MSSAAEVEAPSGQLRRFVEVLYGGGGCEKEREKVSRKEKKKKKRKRDDKVINAREIKALSFSLCLSLPLSLPPRTHM